MTNVIQFPHPAAPVQPIAHYIRLGETGYQKLASLHAAGRFPARRVVVDASAVKHQRELIAALRGDGAEVVLDTKAAELSAPGKFYGRAGRAPWAAVGNGNPLIADHFDPKAGHDIFGQIARFAVEYGVDAVLAPTHFVGDRNFSNWFEVDRLSCIALRRALDREGGGGVTIDYALIAPHVALNDDEIRSNFLSEMDGLPFENLWVRASGFGSDAGPLPIKRFITAMLALHNLGKPIIADYLGGLVGQAALAFGAVSGIAHGAGERERFDARSWHELPKKNEDGQSGGRTVRILIPGLDRSATKDELELMVKARGGHKLIACGNRDCCPHGLQDMIGDPRQHGVYQTFSMVGELSAVPDLNREQHFLARRMVDVERKARQVKDLKFPAEEAETRKIDIGKLTKRLAEHSQRLEKMRHSLEGLHESRESGAPRAAGSIKKQDCYENERRE